MADIHGYNYTLLRNDKNLRTLVSVIIDVT